MSLPFRKTVAALALLAVLAPASPARAGIDRWSPVGPGGGTVLALALDPETPGMVYALAGGDGIYKSTDGGRTWTWIGNGLLGRMLHALALDPRHPRTLFVGMQDNAGGVYRSTNGGRTWKRVLDLANAVDALAVAPGEPSTVFAALGRQVYRSPDGGSTWQLAFETDLAIETLEVDPSDPQTVYAAGHGGVWKSVDGGVSWQRADLLLVGDVLNRLTGVLDVAVAPSDSRRLYAVTNGGKWARSDDGGAIWRLLPADPYGYALAVDPADADTVYVGGVERVLVSRDGGESFEWLFTGYPRLDVENTTPDARDVEIDPHDPGRLWAGVSVVGVLVHEDGQWLQPLQTGLVNNPVDLLGVQPNGTVYARFFPDRAGQTLFSRDGGRTWSPLFPDVFGSLTVRAMAFDRRQPRFAWLTLGDDIFRVGPDGVTLWAPWDPARGPINAFAVLGSREVVAGGCGIWRTADRGQTWSETLRCAYSGPGENKIRTVTRVAVDPNDPDTLFAGAVIYDLGDGSLPPAEIGLHVYISRNRGASWRRLVNGSDLFALDPGRPGAVYVAMGDSVLRSTNYGRTWTRGTFIGSRIMDLAVDPFAAGTLYAATRERGVHRSRDGGATWEPVNAGLARLGRLEISRILADPSVPHRFYTTPFEGGLFQARFTEED